MTIRLAIELGNAAFEDKEEEVARIISEAAAKVADGRSDFKLFDVNGNSVGRLTENDAPLDLESGEKYVVLEMDTDNAAFEDEGKGYEAARIMRVAADKIRSGDLDFKLHDVNGNTVGKVEEVGGRSQVKGGQGGAPIASTDKRPTFAEMKAATPEVSLYEALKAAGIETDHHASDLYVPVTPETKAILAKYPLDAKKATTFKSNIDDKLTYEIPFAYDPAWEKKAKMTVADMRPDIKGKLLVEKAVSLDDAELHRIFDTVAAPEFCIRQAQNARNAGVTMGDIRRESLQEDLQRLEAAGVTVDAVEATIVAMTGTGPEKGEFTGKVIKVDDLLDVMYLSKGLGAARALPLKALSRVPEKDELVKVTFKDGRGEVGSAERGQDKGKGR